MRKKLSPPPPLGTVKITRFLWLPKLINREWRWLERASWEAKRWKGATYGTIYTDAEKWID